MRLGNLEEIGAGFGRQLDEMRAGRHLTLWIEQGESGLAGPAQDLHFRDEGIAQWVRGIDDVEHARAIHDRLKQSHLIGKMFAAF